MGYELLVYAYEPTTHHRLSSSAQHSGASLSLSIFITLGIGLALYEVEEAL